MIDKIIGGMVAISIGTLLLTDISSTKSYSLEVKKEDEDKQKIKQDKDQPVITKEIKVYNRKVYNEKVYNEKAYNERYINDKRFD